MSLLILLGCASLVTASNNNDSLKRVIVDLYSQMLIYPHEKSYVQTDRSFYLSGERMYFRVYLINTSTQRPANFSRYAYVELISPADSVVRRSMVRIDNEKLYYGSFTLPESLPEGNYKIRCYTKYMQNEGDQWYFTRSVYIANPNQGLIDLNPQFDFADKNKIRFSIKPVNKDTRYAEYPKKIYCSMGDHKSMVVNGNDLWAGKSVEFRRGKNTNQTLLIEYVNGNKLFHKYYIVPTQLAKPDVSFYPEGGFLVAGTKNQVAFKALLSDGNVVDVEGGIYNSQNQLQATFKTEHDGMGAFYLNAIEGEHYVARYGYNNNVFEQNLPDPVSNAYALSTKWEGDSLSISVLKGKASVASNLYLFIHQQGNPLYMNRWDGVRNVQKRSREKFKTGVSHVLLLDSNFHVLSERLVFNNRHDEAQVHIYPSRSVCNKRANLTIDLQVEDAAMDTAITTCAISVTDDKDVIPDTTTNILSEILLSSELKGYVKNSAWYFGKDKKIERSADLLMLTHGWRQYNINNALTGELKSPTIKPEKSQQITGMLKKTTGKPYQKAKVKMSALGFNYSEVVESDDKGYFEFSNFEFPDSTAYFLLSYANDKTDDIEIDVDSTIYPCGVNTITGSVEDQSYSLHENDFSAKAEKKYQQEKGIKNIYLNEIEVTAKKIKKSPSTLENFLPLGLVPNKSISLEELREVPPTSYAELFDKISGIQSISQTDGVIVRGNKALILVNGEEVEYADLNTVTDIIEIAQVDFFTDPSVIAMYVKPSKQNGLLMNPGAIIALTTRKNIESADNSHKKNKRTLLPLGYQQPVAFYSPKYDSQEEINKVIPDLRTTIYWKPNVIMDKQGKSSVKFYTADTPTTYSILVEGIGPNKKLIFKRMSAAIKVE